MLEDPVSKFGWTFFQMLMKTHLHLAIEEEFYDMIKKSKGSKPEEKLTDLLLKKLSLHGFRNSNSKALELINTDISLNASGLAYWISQN